MILDFRIGDEVRLRKPHPCGGYIWRVTRLGADIGINCQKCGRFTMLPRSTLERRVKSFVSRGPEPTPDVSGSTPSSSPSHGITCGLLGLNHGDVLTANAEMDVDVVVFFKSGTDTASGRLSANDRVTLAESPAPEATDALVEPVDYRAFEREFVPGGLRGHESYDGYALRIPCAVLARRFTKIDLSD